MTCFPGRLKDTVIVDLIGVSDDGSGGEILAASTLFTVRANVEWKENKDEVKDNKVDRFDVYEITARRADFEADKNRINALRFTVNEGITLYGKEYKLSGGYIIIQATYRYTDAVYVAPVNLQSLWDGLGDSEKNTFVADNYAEIDNLAGHFPYTFPLILR